MDSNLVFDKRVRPTLLQQLRSETISRRQLLGAGLSGLLAAGLWPGRPEAEGRNEEFQFIAMNDTHFRDERDVSYFEALAKFVKSTERTTDFVLHCGDIADGGLLTQIAPVKFLLDQIDKPYYVTPGNHDVDPSDGSLRTYREVFGPQSLNGWFEHKGWQFVGFDSTQGTEWKHPRVQPANMAWLQQTLRKLDSRKPLVVFTHMPLGEDVPMRAANAETVLKMFVKHNLKAVFNGHYHGYTLRHYRGAGISTDRCLSWWRGNMDGSPQKGYFRCRAKAGQVTREFIPFEIKL